MLFLLLVSKKGQKEDKSELETKCKNMSPIPSKKFPTQCLFIDHLNHKIVYKTTCSTPSANPHKL